MPASNSATGDGAASDLVFLPFAIPGTGVEASGQLQRMEQVIEYQDPNRDVKNHYRPSGALIFSDQLTPNLSNLSRSLAADSVIRTIPYP